MGKEAKRWVAVVMGSPQGKTAAFEVAPKHDLGDSRVEAWMGMDEPKKNRENGFRSRNVRKQLETELPETREVLAPICKSTC